MIHIFRIYFVAAGGFVHVGAHAHEKIKLLKKAFAEVVRGQHGRVPVILKPFFRMVHRHRRIRPKIRNHVAAGFVGFALEEVALIAPSQTPPQAAPRAKRGVRNGDFFVVGRVRIVNEEILLAQTARMSFYSRNIPLLNFGLKKISSHRHHIETLLVFFSHILLREKNYLL